VSQSINIRAMQWAYDRDGLGVTAKAVLMTFAMHANAQGYSWPGVGFIASTWRMDRKTVRRQIEALLSLGVIRPTKKRCGATGQVKVYRLPKIAYESGCQRHPFENDESGAKESLKSPISGGGFPPNKEQGKLFLRDQPDTRIICRVPNEASDASEKIWEAYPRKIKKPDGLRAIRKALRKIDADALLAKTRAFAAAQKGGDICFCPHPATWFNAEQWADDASSWLQYGPRRKSGGAAITDPREDIKLPIWDGARPVKSKANYDVPEDELS
jgi:hypothetical protein